MHHKSFLKKVRLQTELHDPDIYVHRVMTYVCAACSRKYIFYVERGIEDPNNSGPWKPTPFCIKCSCGGIASHVGLTCDYSQYFKLEKTANYFANLQNHDSGVPIYRNRGCMPDSVEYQHDAASQLYEMVASKLFEERRKLYGK